MNYKQQTSVDWFFSELERMQYFINNDMFKKYQQAKEMEKEQIIDAYAQGFIESESMDKGAEQFYKETYGE
jgi:hypothetical protein